MNSRFIQLCVRRSLALNRYSSSPASHLEDRGIYESVFPETSAPEVRCLLSQPPQCVYAGFDPTAESLHIGNLFVVTTLLRWQQQGHKVIALIGNATGQIGDPSHRTDERNPITTDILINNSLGIRKNLENISENFKHFICDDGTRSRIQDLTVVDNMDWYRDLNALDFIKEIGRYFRMGPMLSKTSVQTRLNSPTGMSFTEFSYALFQAYDWLQLSKKYECRFQIGGSDQLGNIISGYDLITRYPPAKPVYGLTLPLITAEGGRKFSKSTGNAVWLSAEKSSSFQLYQFFVRSTDADVDQFLRYFTFLDMKEIEEIMQEHRKRPEKRNAQKILAEQVTLLVHGESGLETARNVSGALYGSSISDLSCLKPSDFAAAFEGATTIELTPNSVQTILDLALRANCFKTERDARRIIGAGGFYVNNQRVTDVEKSIVKGEHVLENNLTLLRTGKKTYHIVKWLA